MVVKMKKILNLFFGEVEEFAALEFSFHMAAEFKAYLQSIHISIDDPGVYAEIGMTASVMHAIEATLKTENLKKAEAAKKIYHDKFLTFLEKHNNPQLVFDQHSSWTHISGFPSDLVSKYGRLCDLIIVSQHLFNKKLPFVSSAESALFETGNPVLVVPNVHKAKKVLGGKVALAWDGSIQSSRALHRSLPILQKSKEIVILTAKEEKNKAAHAEDVLTYLSYYNIKAHHKAVDVKDYSVGEALMINALSEKVDSMVMGAYTHNRYRQMVFGGATSFMLGHAEIPIFMVH